MNLWAACTVFDRWDIGIVGSNTILDRDISYFSSVFVLSLVPSRAGRGFAIGRSPSKKSLKLSVGLNVSEANCVGEKVRVPNWQEEDESVRSMIRFAAERCWLVEIWKSNPKGRISAEPRRCGVWLGCEVRGSQIVHVDSGRRGWPRVYGNHGICFTLRDLVD
jgi:hypothetical protein